MPTPTNNYSKCCGCPLFEFVVQKALKENNSGSDAAIDVMFFENDCKKNPPDFCQLLKEKETKNNN